MTIKLTMALTASLLVLGLSGPAHASEESPVSSAITLLGDQANGANYRVERAVPSDGLMHVYNLKTSYGSFEVTGDDLMRVRIRELAALRKLQAMSESDVFAKSFGKAAAAPLRYGVDLLNNPAGTVQKTVSGVSNMFDRVGAGLANANASRDNVAVSVLGVDSARRALAVQLGVDPYTDFPPLASKLNDVASAAALGGLTVKALEMAIPGGAGIAISSVTSADGINGLLADKTAAQIIQIVLGRLQKLQVPADLANHFVQNRAYTPTDLLVMTSALSSMRVGNSVVFVARAADAPTRDEAFFQRRRAELLAANAKKLGIGDFVSVGGFPLNRLKSGQYIALFPFDQVVWTDGVANTFAAVSRAVSTGSAKPALALPGVLTPTALTEVGKLGWTVQRLH